MKIKKQAAVIAQQLGLSLSGVMNGFLHEFVRSKSVNFSLSEIPSEYLVAAIKQAEFEKNKGDYYSFKNSDEALGFLDKIINEKD